MNPKDNRDTAAFIRNNKERIFLSPQRQKERKSTHIGEGQYFSDLDILVNTEGSPVLRDPVET